jgi:hypothetical protein
MTHNWSDLVGDTDPPLAAKRPAVLGGQVILIPKSLRMEWTDALALDPQVGNMPFRVACVISSHFNHRSGETFVSQITVARIMGVSPRSVWSAIVELERLGYLIVQRREFGARASDGRRGPGLK